MNGQCFEFWHSQYGDLRIVEQRGKLYYCLHDVVRIFGKDATSMFNIIANSEGEVKEFFFTVGEGCVFSDGSVAPASIKDDKADVWVAFVDATLLKDIEANPTNAQRLVIKWIHKYVQKQLDVTKIAENYECAGVLECYDTTDFAEEGLDIRLTDEGLIINRKRIV